MDRHENQEQGQVQDPNRTRDQDREQGQDALTAAYRAHAKARLRGDRAEARRLADGLGFEMRMTHLIFTFCLFGQVVLDRFGDDLDRKQLAAFTKQLWKKHRGNPRFEPLKAEMLIRAIYGEDSALTEIAQTEQSGYLWAVMEALVDQSSSEAVLEERFDLADQLGREWLADIFASPAFTPWRPDRAAEAPGAEGTGE